MNYNFYIFAAALSPVSSYAIGGEMEMEIHRVPRGNPTFSSAWRTTAK